MLDLNRVFQQWGVPPGAFARIKGGRGVVGRVSHVQIVALLMLGVIAWQTKHDGLLVLLMLAVCALAGGTLFWLPRWAQNNPQLAVMEGLDWAAYKQAETAALSVPRPPDDLPVIDPGTPPQPKLPSAGREGAEE